MIFHQFFVPPDERNYLRFLISNEEDVLHCLNPPERATSKPLDFNLKATPAGHVLSIQWSSKDVTFSFSVDLKDQPLTCHDVLFVIASLDNTLYSTRKAYPARTVS